MKRVFVDANVFLRFFAEDDDGQHERAATLFRRAATGDVALVTGPPVLFEVAWTLRTAYKQPSDKVWEVLRAMAALPGLQLTDAAIVEEALALTRDSGRGFADAYIAALTQHAGAESVATFNERDFKRLGTPLHEF